MSQEDRDSLINVLAMAAIMVGWSCLFYSSGLTSAKAGMRKRMYDDPAWVEAVIEEEEAKAKLKKINEATE